MAQELTRPQSFAGVATQVASSLEVRVASETAARTAAEVGFPETHQREIALAVVELGTNLLRHASRGAITVTPLEAGGTRGIQIDSEDSGPGIADVELAITDGYSTAGGLGFGLGTVNRLMDELDFCSTQDGGLHLVAKRWVRPGLGVSERKLAFGVATRPYRHSKENGDSFLIKQWSGNALVGVIDGLGHGQFAQRASQTAREYVEQHFDQPLEKVFRGAGRACRATRGAVMALARFDLERGKVSLASVGNVEVRLLGGTAKLNLLVRRGIVGLNAPEAVVGENEWTPASLLVMHSDGLSPHWHGDELRSTPSETPGTIAPRMLKTLGKTDDDATVVVAGNVVL